MEDKKTGIDLPQDILAQIKNLQQRKKALVDELASIGELRIIIQNREEQAKQFYNVNNELEKSIAKKIEETFGQGRVDIEQGLFYPIN